ncbi:MAG: ankyrin repeat domain-containing protein [Vicinamibacterales bacterium]
MTRNARRSPRAVFAVAALAGLIAGVTPASAQDARLVEAAKAKDAATVGALLDKKADPNQRMGDGATALHWAAYWGDAALVDRLIRAGAKVDAANDLGVTPLMLASVNEDPAAATRLLAAGANANVATRNGQTALMAAARAGRADAAAALAAHGADLNARESTHDQTALMWAAANRRPDVVRVLLQAGADLNARSRVRLRKSLILTNRQASYNPGAYEKHLKDGDIVEVKQGGYTALLFSAQQGDVASARHLIAAGANVNDTAPDGMSALLVAAYSDHLDVGKFLLDKGADPNAAEVGFAPLHAAVLKANLGFVETLLAHGADPNQPITKPNGARRQSADFAFGHTLVGATPLYLAAKFAEIPIMRALAAGGADLAFRMPDGTTPIMAAMDTPKTDSGDVEGLGRDRRDRYVFFRMARTTSPDDVKPKSPEEEENDVLAMVTFLSTGNVDLNVANDDGDTAIHVAAAEGLNRVIEFLASRKVNINPKNGRRQTPLDLAMAPRRNRGGDSLGFHEETAALLRSLGGEEGGEPVPNLRPRQRRPAGPQ